MANVTAHYVDCAFNFNNQGMAFIFTDDQCLLINYVPGTTRHFIIRGPISIADYFPSLRGTSFATGIDAAFTSSAENQVYIFKNNKYALLNFVSGLITEGPGEITDGFHSFRNTIFKDGIDAAFASSQVNEAYIFKDNQYGVIKFAPGAKSDYWVSKPQEIIRGFPYFRNYDFADGLDAAFSATTKNEAYIFKGKSYARINYTPGQNGFIIENGTPITDGFPCLNGIIPWYPLRN